MKEKTCAERIESELANFEEQVREFNERAEDPNADEYFDGIEIYSVEHLETVRFQLSGGGPASWVEVTHSFGEIRKVVYFFQDWFDFARLDVAENSPVYDWASQMLEIQRVGE